VNKLVDLWERLNRLTRFSFKVNPSNSSLIGWQGEGSGLIKRRSEHSQMTPGALLETIERGEYAIAPQCKLTMHNHYLWQFEGDHIRLTHLRFGWDKPVFLFDIIENKAGEIVTRQSHQCAADNYNALFTLLPEGISVQWHIQGPNKCEVLDYVYSI
jgi:hypothetical protein